MSKAFDSIEAKQAREVEKKREIKEGEGKLED
jgi:hypothetical protein